MLMLAYLMTRNEPWLDARIRLLVSTGTRKKEQALEAVHAMLDEIRIEAEPVLVEGSDAATIRRTSADSAAVFVPFGLRPKGPVSRLGGSIEELLDGLPLTALVLAAEGVDLEADTEPEAEDTEEPAQPEADADAPSD